jgi:hypothetical protein
MTARSYAIVTPLRNEAEKLEEFDREPELGLVSGACFERDGDAWRERFGTGASVWGAARAYRETCLSQLLPIEPRTAWDWIDAAEARSSADGRPASSATCPFTITAVKASRHLHGGPSGRHRDGPLTTSATDPRT